MKLDKTAVIAIGGNFLSDGKSGLNEQMIRSNQAAQLVRSLVLRNFNVVVVHGNAIVQAEGEEKLGNYDLFIREKLDEPEDGAFLARLHRRLEMTTLS